MTKKTTSISLQSVLGEHLSKASKFNRCAFGTWLEKQDDDTRKGFETISQAKNLSIERLYHDLTSAGIDMPCKLTTFRNHMRGFCICQKN